MASARQSEKRARALETLVEGMQQQTFKRRSNSHTLPPGWARVRASARARARASVKCPESPFLLENFY